MLALWPAVIVESFLKTKTAVEDMQAESDFFTDILGSIHAGILSWRYGWPDRDDVMRALSLSNKLHITPSDLHAMLLAHAKERYSYWSVRAMFNYYRFRVPLRAPLCSSS